MRKRAVGSMLNNPAQLSVGLCRDCLTGMGVCACTCEREQGSWLSVRLTAGNHGDPGRPAPLPAASRRRSFLPGRLWTPVCTLLSESVSVFPNHREMYASEPGNRTHGVSSDNHSVSSFFFSPPN